MAQKTLTQFYREAFDKAPPAVQAYITSGQLASFVQATQTKYALEPAETDALGTELLTILLGLQPAETFVTNLVGRARIGEETLEKLVEEINAKVLQPLKARMSIAVTAPVPPPPPINRLEPTASQVPASSKPTQAATPSPTGASAASAQLASPVLSKPALVASPPETRPASLIPASSAPPSRTIASSVPATPTPPASVNKVVQSAQPSGRHEPSPTTLPAKNEKAPQPADPYREPIE